MAIYDTRRRRGKFYIGLCYAVRGHWPRLAGDHPRARFCSKVFAVFRPLSSRAIRN